MAVNSEELVFLRNTISKPGGSQAVRLCLHAGSSLIPGLNGLAAGFIALQSEKEQQKFNQSLINWAETTSDELGDLVTRIKELEKSPSSLSLILLLGELFGDEVVRTFNDVGGTEIVAILNPASVSELESYVSHGFIELRSTGSTCSMGCGNRIGGHLEELKRPYGQGVGFKIVIKPFQN